MNTKAVARGCSSFKCVASGGGEVDVEDADSAELALCLGAVVDMGAVDEPPAADDEDSAVLALRLSAVVGARVVALARAGERDAVSVANARCGTGGRASD